MKKANKYSFLLFAVVFILACSLPRCSSDVGLVPTAKEVIEKNTAIIDEGVAMVRDVQKADANYFLKVNSCNAKMDRQLNTAQAYSESVNANTESWTGNFKDEKAAFNKILEEYAKTGGDPSNLNLENLQKNGAMPSDMNAAFGLYINAVVQAPPPQIDSKIWQSVIDTQGECFDSIYYVGTVANDKTTAYNTWRSQTEGKLVAAANDVFKQVSEKVGFDIPESLPLITGGISEDTQLK